MTDETTTEALATPETPKITFGFAVLIDEDGNVFVERTKDAFALPVERDATLLEVRRYASEILMDLQAQAAAEYSALRIQALQAQDAQPSA